MNLDNFTKDFMEEVVMPIVEKYGVEEHEFSSAIIQFKQARKFHVFYDFCIVPENMPEVFQQLCEADSEELAADYIDMWSVVDHWTVGELLDAVNVDEI